MASSLHPLVRLAAAATATSFLLVAGGAAHAVGTAAADEAAVTSDAPGDGAGATAEPVEPPADEQPGEEQPTEPPAEEQPAPIALPDPASDDDLLDPALWTARLQEDGIVDAACSAAELPAPGELFVADQDYLLVLDFYGIASEEVEIFPWVEVYAGEAIEVGTDPDNDALIVCTGTVPADWDDWDEAPGGNDDTAGGGTGTVDGGTETVGGRGDDAGESLGPVVQTDRPVQGGSGPATGALVLAAAGGMAALGLRRRLQG